MNSEKIAKILYALSLDMDYADGIEFMDDEVEEIAAELDLLKEIKCDSLIQVLEVIAGKNEDRGSGIETLKECKSLTSAKRWVTMNLL